jgi:biopolymer transport protein ExbB/TolQ
VAGPPVFKEHMNGNITLTTELFQLPLFNADWVLWFLIFVSMASAAIMLERWFFFRRRAININDVHSSLEAFLDAGDYQGAETYLTQFDSLQTNVTLRGLRKWQQGATAVQSTLTGSEPVERLRFARGLSVLATVGSNAPFIGLFGTVLGIIRAFQDLSQGLGGASNSVMSGISEALVATAVVYSSLFPQSSPTTCSMGVCVRCKRRHSC